MARTISSTLSTAIGQNSTRPVYLVRINIGDGIYVATWASDIVWITADYTAAESPLTYNWIASNLSVTQLDSQHATIRAPLDDTWLGIALTNAVRGTGVRIYQHYFDATASPTADAVLLFDGIMDGADFGKDLTITCIEMSRVKHFPPQRIDQPIFTYLPRSGSKIRWGDDTITVR